MPTKLKSRITHHVSRITFHASRIFSLAFLVFFAANAPAQIFVGYVNLTGTNWAPVQSGFVTISNVAYSSLPGRTLVVQNINTNETITLQYGYQLMGASSASTNPVVMQTVTTNFPASAGWTNGATWYFTVPAAGFTPAVVPWGGLNISNGQFTSGSCTNPVSFQ